MWVWPRCILPTCEPGSLACVYNYVCPCMRSMCMVCVCVVCMQCVRCMCVRVCVTGSKSSFAPQFLMAAGSLTCVAKNHINILLKVYCSKTSYCGYKGNGLVVVVVVVGGGGVLKREKKADNADIYTQTQLWLEPENKPEATKAKLTWWFSSLCVPSTSPSCRDRWRWPHQHCAWWAAPRSAEPSSWSPQQCCLVGRRPLTRQHHISHQ